METPKPSPTKACALNTLRAGLANFSIFRSPSKKNNSIWDPEDDDFPAGNPFAETAASTPKTPSAPTPSKAPSSPVKSIWDPDEDDFTAGNPYAQTGPATPKAIPSTPSKSPSKSMWDPDEDEFPPDSPFAPAMTPSKLPKTPSKSPSKNIWDPDEDEFPPGSPFKASFNITENKDWPGTYKSSYGSFNGTNARRGLTSLTIKHRPLPLIPKSTLSRSAAGYDTTNAINRMANASEEDLELQDEEHIRDAIAELQDPACGHPKNNDLHDDLLSEYGFYQDRYIELPSNMPARHMHIVDSNNYTHSIYRNEIMAQVKPRLCDGVATVLLETDPKALGAFLDGGVKVFQWRHEFTSTKNGLMCAIIRREGSEVLVGVYRNLGFTYLYPLITKSRIDFTGKWTDVWASTNGTTAASQEGPVWTDFTPSPAMKDQDPTDANYALYIGRQLASYLMTVERLSRGHQLKLWEFGADVGETLEWEADGVVTKATVRLRRMSDIDEESDEE